MSRNSRCESGDPASAGTGVAAERDREPQANPSPLEPTNKAQRATRLRHDAELEVRKTTMTSLSRERERQLRRLHSATGILPVGAFFVAHLWINARALQGAAPFERVTDRLQHWPLLALLEVVLVYVPLTVHAALGARIVWQGGPALPRGPGDKPWAVPLQRLTGVVSLLFLLLHVWQFRIQLLLGNVTSADFFPLLCDRLSTTTSAGIPLNAALYLVGLAATSYHFANGVLGACYTFDVALARVRPRLVSACCTGVGMATFLVGASTVLYFATGATWPGGDSAPNPPDGVGTLRLGMKTSD
jgi:succinate dehydrogenase/fumarate reductase cytochrome b subunit (b558 family)